MRGTKCKSVLGASVKSQDNNDDSQNPIYHTSLITLPVEKELVTIKCQRQQISTGHLLIAISAHDSRSTRTYIHTQLATSIYLHETREQSRYKADHLYSTYLAVSHGELMDWQNTPPHPRHMGLGLVWLEQVFRWWDTARWLPMELSSSFTEHMYTYVSLGDTQRCWLIHTLAINSWRSVLSNIVTLKHRSYTDIGGHLPFRYGDVITPSIIISYSAG